jgi:hypothetical protein
MTAVLAAEQFGETPPLKEDDTSYDGAVLLGAYNEIAASGLIYFDSLRAMEPELLQGPHTLAHFPYHGGAEIQDPAIPSMINHARESFLIGLALRTDTLPQLDSLVDGVNDLSPELPARELLRFSGRVVLERAYFESDVTITDGNQATASGTQRTIAGSGLLAGVSYEIAPLFQKQPL